MKPEITLKEQILYLHSKGWNIDAINKRLSCTRYRAKETIFVHEQFIKEKRKQENNKRKIERDQNPETKIKKIPMKTHKHLITIGSVFSFKSYQIRTVERTSCDDCIVNSVHSLSGLCVGKCDADGKRIMYVRDDHDL